MTDKKTDKKSAYDEGQDAAVNQRKDDSQRGGYGDSFKNFNRVRELGINKYKIKDGVNSLIILHPPVYKMVAEGSAEEKPYWGYIFGVHYSMGVNNSAYACPDYFRKYRCPCCEEMMKARDMGEDTLAKKYKSAIRAMYYVIDVQDSYNITRQNVKLWIGSEYAHDRELTNRCTKRVQGENGWVERKINPTNPENPFIFSFNMHKAVGQNQYDTFDLTEARAFDPEPFLDLPPLEELIVWHDYERMSETIRIGVAPTQIDEGEEAVPEEDDVLGRVKDAVQGTDPK